jgi:hypothetical protein
VIRVAHDTTWHSGSVERAAVLETLQAVLDDGMSTESEACCSEPPAKRAVTR